MVDLRVSVIVPVYCDIIGLTRTLESLVAQDFPAADYEVIVADNGSPDGTPGVVDRFASSPVGVRLVRETAVRGSYAARNKGIAAARGRVLCFIDADMTAPRRYLRDVVDHLERSGADYMGCNVEVCAEGGTLAARFSRVKEFPVRKYIEVDRFAPTCCLTVRRPVFDVVGLFDARLESGGDMEFGHRVYAAGLTQGFAGQIRLQHPARTRYTALLAKAARVARGMAQLRHYHPERYADICRKHFTLRFHLPANPAFVKRRLAEIGEAPGAGTAILFAFMWMPLHWVQPVAILREARRLRRTAAGLPDGSGRGADRPPHAIPPGGQSGA